MGNGLNRDEVKSFIEADIILHKLLLDNCGNEPLAKMLMNIMINILFIELPI